MVAEPRVYDFYQTWVNITNSCVLNKYSVEGISSVLRSLYFMFLLFLKYPKAFRVQRWMNWFHGISRDDNNHSEISTSEKGAVPRLVFHETSWICFINSSRGTWKVQGSFFATPTPLSSYFHFGIPPVEILATQRSVQNSKWGSPLTFPKYRGVPNGSGMRSESKAVAELLNLSPRLSSPQLHVDSACFCVQAEDGIREVGLCVNFSH